MKIVKNFLLQAVASSLQLGKGGLKLKDSSGVLQIRNAADSAYVNLEALSVIASSAVQSDTINEYTSAAGVTVDGVLIKDGLVDGKDVSGLAENSAVVHNTGNESVAGIKTFTDGIKSDTVNEETADAGVTVDGVLIKDGLVDGKDVSTLATDADVVHKTGTETVGGDKTFSDNIVITGNLTVNGTQTIINTETLTIDDNIIVLNDNVTGSPTQDAGIEVERGTSTNAQLLFNETTDKWEFGIAGDLKNIADDALLVHLAGTETVTGDKSFSGALKVDIVSELTSAAGVTVDGVLLKDAAVNVDTINEKTSAAGVTIDGVLIKDGLVDGKDVSALALDVDVIKKDGSVAFTGNQSMGTNKLTNLGTPTTSTDAATKAYVDSVASSGAVGVLKCIQLSIGTSDASSTASIPASAVVMRTYLDVTTAYSNGALIQLIVDGTSDEEIMGTGHNDAQSIGVYAVEPHAVISASTTGIVKAVVTGSPAAGACKAKVEYYETFIA